MLTPDQLLKSLKDSSRAMQVALEKGDLVLYRAQLVLQIRAYEKLSNGPVNGFPALPPLPPLPDSLKPL